MASVECIQEAVRMLVAERQGLRERDGGRNELESNRLELAGRPSGLVVQPMYSTRRVASEMKKRT
jgi:hypothetical protein